MRWADDIMMLIEEPSVLAYSKVKGSNDGGCRSRENCFFEFAHNLVLSFREIKYLYKEKNRLKTSCNCDIIKPRKAQPIMNNNRQLSIKLMTAQQLLTEGPAISPPFATSLRHRALEQGDKLGRKTVSSLLVGCTMHLYHYYMFLPKHNSIYLHRCQ